jgi:hypothetical protein
VPGTTEAIAGQAHLSGCRGAVNSKGLESIKGSVSISEHPLKCHRPSLTLGRRVGWNGYQNQSCKVSQGHRC